VEFMFTVLLVHAKLVRIYQPPILPVAVSHVGTVSAESCGASRSCLRGISQKADRHPADCMDVDHCTLRI